MAVSKKAPAGFNTLLRRSNRSFDDRAAARPLYLQTQGSAASFYYTRTALDVASIESNEHPCAKGRILITRLLFAGQSSSSQALAIKRLDESESNAPEASGTPVLLRLWYYYANPLTSHAAASSLSSLNDEGRRARLSCLRSVLPRSGNASGATESFRATAPVRSAPLIGCRSLFKRLPSNRVRRLIGAAPLLLSRTVYFYFSRLFFSELGSGKTGTRFGVTAYIISVRDRLGEELIRLTRSSANLSGSLFYVMPRRNKALRGSHRAVRYASSAASSEGFEGPESATARTADTVGWVSNKVTALADKVGATARRIAAGFTGAASAIKACASPILLKRGLLFEVETSADSFASSMRRVLSDATISSFFYTSGRPVYSSSILPSSEFTYAFRRRILKVFDFSKFPNITAYWHYQVLCRFLEYCAGKRVCFKFHPFLSNDLNFYEKAQCALWAQRVKYYRRVLGPRLFLAESLQIIYLFLKLKDPFMLSNWMVSTFQKISFWKFKMFLRYLKYSLRNFFWVLFKQLRVRGVKFQLKGKISVAGNARTRTAFHYVGFTSHTTFDNKILHALNLIRTFTGVQGLKLWIVF